MARLAPRSPGRTSRGRATLGSIAIALSCAGAVCDAQVPASVFGSRAAQQPQQPQPAAQTPRPAVPRQAPGSVLQPPAPAPTAAAMRAISSVPGAAGQRGASNVEERLKKAGGIIKTSEVRAYSPRRNEILNRQIDLMTEQNALARSLRANSAALSPRNATVGAKPAAAALGNRSALLTSTFGSQAQSDATRATAYADTGITGIIQVNGKNSAVTVTPGGSLAISGRGFGAETGLVTVIVEHGMNRISLPIGAWQDDAIYATLPAGIRNLQDQPAKLQVISHAGKVYELDDVKFFATREEVLLTSRLTQLYHLVEGGSWPAYSDDQGEVSRGTLDQGSVDCRPAGTDTLVFAPANGFEVSGVVMWHGRTDTGDGDSFGNAGSRVFFPGYSIGEWTQDALKINWGVWRDYSSPMAAGVVAASEFCLSNYRVAVSVVGPAGVSPF